MKKLIFFILVGLLFPLSSFAGTRELTCEEVTELLATNQTKSFKFYDSNGVIEVAGSDDNNWTITFSIGALGLSSICNYTWKLIEPDITTNTKMDVFLAANMERLVIIWQGEPKYYAQRTYTRGLLFEDLIRINNNISNNQLLEIKKNDIKNAFSGAISNNSNEFLSSIEESKKVLEQKSQSGAIITSIPNISLDTQKLTPAGQKRAALFKKRIAQLEKQLSQLRTQLSELK